jgi:hypothetical protein
VGKAAMEASGGYERDWTDFKTFGFHGAIARAGLTYSEA